MDNGLRLRSSGCLRGGAQRCRAPAGGGVVTQLDAPRVTGPRPRRAAPPVLGGGLRLLPGGAAGVPWAPQGSFPLSPPRRAPRGPRLGVSQPQKVTLCWGRGRGRRDRGPGEGRELSSKDGGASASARGDEPRTPSALPRRRERGEGLFSFPLVLARLVENEPCPLTFT